MAKGLSTLGCLWILVILLALTFTTDTALAQGRIRTVNSPEGAKCADEGGSCNFSGPGTVYYGVGTRWVVRPNSSSGVRCSNEVFGDPAPNETKSCYFQGTRSSREDYVATNSGFPQGTRCGAEGQRCQFRGAATVHYGAGSSWVSRAFVNGVNCTNSAFGDPAPDVVKACYVEPAASAPDGQRCANEGGLCNFRGSATVYYGAGRSWVSQHLRGPVECSNAVFGDPAINASKSCFVEGNRSSRWR